MRRHLTPILAAGILALSPCNKNHFTNDFFDSTPVVGDCYEFENLPIMGVPNRVDIKGDIVIISGFSGDSLLQKLEYNMATRKVFALYLPNTPPERGYGYEKLRNYAECCVRGLEARDNIERNFRRFFSSSETDENI
ncbi:MAG: hypothetical protein WC533_04170 [Candidatus Pacearchaeota archaeon]